MSKQKNVRNPIALIILSLMIVSLLLTACGTSTTPAAKPYTIGIVSYVSVLEPVIKGFKEGMAELGYVEGENVTYIYNGVVEPDAEVIDTEIQNLLAKNVDLLFTVGNLTTSRAKQAVEGTDIPVVFGAVINPVGEGFVESIAHPGGNLTGVQGANNAAKAMEWLLKITPGLDKIYLPYNPDDAISMSLLPGLQETASVLGVELVLGEVQSVDEAAVAIESLPEDIDAILRVPTPSLYPNDALSQAAIKRGLPMGASLALDEAVLVTITGDLFGTGKQTARIAHSVIQGANSADLPVETSDFISTINLKTADAISLHISDDFLRQVDNIIR